MEKDLLEEAAASSPRRASRPVAINAGTSSRAVMQLVRDVGIEGEILLIARLLIDPDLRRRGLETRLLEEARRETIARDGRPALDVVLTPSAAISSYRAAGWHEIGRTVLNPHDGRVLEELVLLEHATSDDVEATQPVDQDPAIQEFIQLFWRNRADPTSLDGRTPGQRPC
jgi:hypothetical protein